MRKPDSLAQMAQCEGAFSENPETFRGSFLIATGTDCRYRSHTDRDPGIRSEGGPPGSSQESGHMTRAQSLAFRKASICVAATLLAAAFLAFPKGAARADDKPLTFREGGVSYSAPIGPKKPMMRSIFFPSAEIHAISRPSGRADPSAWTTCQANLATL